MKYISELVKWINFVGIGCILSLLFGTLIGYIAIQIVEATS